MNGKYPKNRHYGTKKKLLLVGAGHAHLQVLKSMRRKRWPETEVTLISPSRFQYYSGMFSGLIEGHYTLDEVRIDVKRLTAPAASGLWKRPYATFCLWNEKW